MVQINHRQKQSHIDIHRQGPLGVVLSLPLTVIWISLRFLLVPLLWIPYRLGSSMDFAFVIDSVLKRTVLPLTERADSVVNNSGIPARLPDVPLTQLTSPTEASNEIGEQKAGGLPTKRNEPFRLSEFARGRPLLLIAYRGSWCPYSRLHLANLATIAEQLDHLGVAVLAVSARNHCAWWWSKGVRISFAADPAGDLFRALGVFIEPPLSDRLWGLLLPDESVFLFDRDGKLVTSDVRQLGFELKQTFCSAENWLLQAQDLQNRQ